MASTVFITHSDGRFDLRDCERFGSIRRVLFRQEVYPDTVDDQIDGVYEHARNVLSHFNPSTDFLCLVGSPLYVAVCCHVLGILGKRGARLLRYDKVHGGYYSIQLP